MSGMIRVRFLNNDGNGFSNDLSIAPGQSLLEFLNSQGISDPSRYNISVNGQLCNIPDQVVRDGDRIAAVSNNPNNPTVQQGDRISVAPKNVGGAIVLARTM